MSAPAIIPNSSAKPTRRPPQPVLTKHYFGNEPRSSEDSTSCKMLFLDIETCSASHRTVDPRPGGSWSCLMLRTLTPLSKRGVLPAGRCLLTLVKPQSELSFTESRSSLPDICSCLCPSSHLPLQKVGTSGVVCLMRITDP